MRCRMGVESVVTRTSRRTESPGVVFLRCRHVIAVSPQPVPSWCAHQLRCQCVVCERVGTCYAERAGRLASAAARSRCFEAENSPWPSGCYRLRCRWWRRLHCRSAVHDAARDKRHATEERTTGRAETGRQPALGRCFEGIERLATPMLPSHRVAAMARRACTGNQVNSLENSG